MVTELTLTDMTKGLPIPDDDVRIIMFYGSTCGPCKATMPHYEAASDFFESKGAKIQFFRFNAWEPTEQAVYCKDVWKIEGVPTFKAFCRGQQIKEKIGGGDEPTMKAFIQDVIDEAFKIFQEKI